MKMAINFFLQFYRGYSYRLRINYCFFKGDLSVLAIKELNSRT